MRFLTVNEVIELHRRIMLVSGGTSGIRDMGLLESAIAQPRMTFDGQELHPSLAEKAATLGFALIRNHPFLDGNKRISHAATEVFLVLNGFEISALAGEQESLFIGLASGRLTKEEFTEWGKIFLVEKGNNHLSAGDSEQFGSAVSYPTDKLGPNSKRDRDMAIVGIFYFIRGVSHWIGEPFFEVEAVAGIVDLGLCHSEFWERIVEMVPDLQLFTHEQFPRGRVLLNGGCFEIHLDRCLASGDYMEIIKEEMRLPPETVVVPDEFYICASCQWQWRL